MNDAIFCVHLYPSLKNDQQVLPYDIFTIFFTTITILSLVSKISNDKRSHETTKI